MTQFDTPWERRLVAEMLFLLQNSAGRTDKFPEIRSQVAAPSHRLKERVTSRRRCSTLRPDLTELNYVRWHLVEHAPAASIAPFHQDFGVSRFMALWYSRHKVFHSHSCLSVHQLTLTL